MGEYSCPHEHTFEDLDPNTRYLVSIWGEVVTGNRTVVESPSGNAIGATGKSSLAKINNVSRIFGETFNDNFEEK